MTVTCVKCRRPVAVNCSEEQYMASLEGGLSIQVALPWLSPAERELFLSGYCGECFEGLFPDEEDD